MLRETGRLRVARFLSHRPVLNRFQAGAIHLALSAMVVTAVFLPIYFFWYPGALFEAAGGLDLLLLVACVDLTLGPIITTTVYRHGKRGMKFDLVVIATMQLLALAYGVSVMFESRPVYVVFVKDRYELVRANQVAENDLGKSPRKSRAALSLWGPRLVGAVLPTDPEEKFQLGISGLGGVDVQAYPQFHVPYEQVREQAAAKAAPIAKLRRLNPADTARIDRMVAKLGPEQELGFIPLRAGKTDLSVVLSKSTGNVLAYASQRPWEY